MRQTVDILVFFVKDASVDTLPSSMKALKYLSFLGKLAGIITAVEILPIGDPKTGLIIFAVALMSDLSPACFPTPTWWTAIANGETLEWEYPPTSRAPTGRTERRGDG